jgi:Protein of unknown function (DUF3108)
MSIQKNVGLLPGILTVVFVCAGVRLHLDPSGSPLKGRSWVAVSSLLALPLSPADSSAFQVGERLTYRISWSNFVEAGTAELSLSQGSPTVANFYRLQLKAITTPAISGIYTFKDEFVSLFDAGLGAPTLFEKNFIEKKRTVIEKVVFDQVNRSATFTNSKKQTQTIPIDLGTQDPLSALYSVRSLGLKPGLQVMFPVLDGGKSYQVEIRVTGSDLISTSLGSFNTHRMEVVLRREGVAVNDKKITVWFTNDPRKIPVLASVSLPLGAALIELTSMSN